MAMFNRYVKLPEGNSCKFMNFDLKNSMWFCHCLNMIQRLCHKKDIPSDSHGQAWTWTLQVRPRRLDVSKRKGALEQV
jgi:hypothetical protein